MVPQVIPSPDQSRWQSHSDTDPIVICGLACRLPGGIRNTEDFWNLMMEKRSGLIPVPKDRWNIDGFYSEVPRLGTLQNKECYLLQEDLTKFDASHFTCGGAEIEKMDPMQRQLLEIARECLDNAGETDWNGKEIGCYVGNFSSDWQDSLSLDPHSGGLYRGSGYLDFLQPNRISYEFGWTGPSMLIKTGCSSSMVALSLAAEAVQSGACTSAMALGCNLITSVITSIVFTETGVLSASGKCKTFDLMADGYGRGEAVNAVYVKKLSDALRDGNPIRAVLRSSATNNDGRSNGIMQPNTYLQEALIRKTYEKAGIQDFSKTAFFECHGTGTPTGDPLEVAAVARVWGEHGGIMIGAVKPNVGHSEGAAGLSSIIKAVLALEHRIIPPNIYLDNPNPRIPWDSAKLSVPLEATPWPEGKEERISVNSFGVAGSNAHCILESYEGWLHNMPGGLASSGSSDSGFMISHQVPGPRLLLLSTTHMDSLDKHVEQYKEYLGTNSTDLDNVAYTLGHHRNHLSCRAYVTADKQGSYNISKSQRRPNSKRRVIFAFTGQGVSWEGMGKSLLETNPVFGATIQKLDKWLQALPAPFTPSWTIEEELLKEGAANRVGKRGLSHPCATAVQIALTDLLYSLNIFPDGVTGHSGGECGASYASGSISAEAALAVAYFRGWILVNHSPPIGTMAAVGLGPKEVEPFLIPGVVIGCYNSPMSTTLSGDPACIRHCIDQILRRHPDVRSKVLNLETSFHSPWISKLGAPYEELLKPYLSDVQAPKVPHFSSVTGLKMTGNDFGPEYWHRNFVQPVLFDTAMRTLIADNVNNFFIEIGPHPALSSPINDILRSVPDATSNCEYIGTLRKGEHTNISYLRLAGELWLQNLPVNLSKVIPNKGHVLTNLPQYPWHHDTTYWDEPRNSRRFKQRQYTRHDLLGCRVLEGNSIEPAWRNMLDLKECSWLLDHVVNEQVVLPATCYVSMAGEAMRQTSNGQSAYTIRDMSITTGMTLFKDKKMELYTRLIPEDTHQQDVQWYNFKIMSNDGHCWVSHCSGFVRAGADLEKMSIKSSQAQQDLPRQIATQEWYNSVRRIGIDWKSSFQGLDYITAGVVTREATATVYDFEDTTRYAAHPALLDQLLQLNLIAMTNGLKRRLTSILLPTWIGTLAVLGDQELAMRGYGSVKGITENNITGHAAIFTDDGRPTVYMENLKYSELPTGKKDDHLLGSKFDWKTDITLLDSVAEIQAHENGADVVTRHKQDFVSILAALGFKCPDARILEIASPGPVNHEMTRLILDTTHPDTHRRFYTKNTYVCLTEDAVEAATTAVVDITTETTDLSVISIDQIATGGAVDIAILPLETLLTEDFTLLQDLNELKEILTSNGRMIVYSHDISQGVDVVEAKSKLNLLGFKVHSHTSSGVILAEVETVTENIPKKITVLTHNTDRGKALGNQVQRYFGNKGQKVEISHNTTIPADQTLVFSLLDLEDATVYNLNSDTFRPFVDSLINYQGSLIWATPSAHILSRDPRTAMIQGLARTIRMEYKDKVDVTIVEVDDQFTTQEDFPKALWKISQSLFKRRKGGNLDPDTDYAIVNGQIQIPRMNWFSLKDPLAGNSVPTSNETKMFREDVSYLLVGGTGGLGKSVATWMIEHGARNLIILSRSAMDKQHTPFMKELESYPGLTLTLVSGDAGEYKNVLAAICKAPKPVAGIMQLSLVLKDNSTAEMTYDEWKDVIQPRVNGTWNLHRAILDSQPQLSLDFFVIFGSGGGHTGYYGQANYSASNTYLDAFVEYRQSLGLAASIVDLGVVGDIGYLLENEKLYEGFKNGGFFFLNERQVLDAAAIAIAQSRGGPLHSFCLGGLSEKPLSDPTNRVNWKRDVRFALSHHFHKKTSSNVVDEGTDGNNAENFLMLASTDHETLRSPETVARLARYVSSALSILMLKPFEETSLTDNLISIGLDSIVSIELVDWIHQQFHIGMSSMEVTQCSTLMHLAEKIVEQLLSC